MTLGHALAIFAQYHGQVSVNRPFGTKCFEYVDLSWRVVDVVITASHHLANASLQVVIFYSLMPSGELDYSSQHIGCNVTAGTKWAANFWLWSQASPMNRGGTDAVAFQDELEAQLALGASC